MQPVHQFHCVGLPLCARQGRREGWSASRKGGREGGREGGGKGTREEQGGSTLPMQYQIVTRAYVVDHAEMPRGKL